METENKSKLPIITVGLGIMAVLLFLVVWGINRSKPMIIVFMYYWIALIVIGIILVIIWLVIFFIKPQRKDMVWINKQRIIAACKSRPPTFKQVISFRGETELEQRFIGYVIGMCRLTSEPKKEIVVDEYTQSENLKPVEAEQELWCVAFRKGSGLISSLILPVEVIIAPRDDFTDLNMDVIYVKDSCFAPKLYDLLMPAKNFKETHLMDEPVKNLIYRYVLQENLVEIREIAADYLAISPQYQKARSLSRAQEFGMMGNRGGGNAPPSQ